jgi:hypothetical protein
MSESTFKEFIAINRKLLDCYASVYPQEYKLMDAPMQKDFCFQERVKVEDFLMRGKISPKDFFAVAHK